MTVQKHAGGNHDRWTEVSETTLITDSFFKFTLQWKSELYLGFEQAIFKDAGAEGRFSYPGDHPLASEFEEQTTSMVCEYKGEGEYLYPPHPDESGAHDDAPDSTALALMPD